MNGLTNLTEKRLKELLVDSKRVGTSRDFISLIEAAIHQKKLLKEKERHQILN